MYTRHYLGPRFRVCRDYFDPLSDKHCYERCEGARKTPVSCACHCGHWYSHGRVGEVGSQLFRAAGNAETGFSEPFQSTFFGYNISVVRPPASSI